MRKKPLNKNHLKIHLVAVTAISAIVIVLFFMFGGDKKPAPQGPVEIVGTRFITIDTATWGRNCDLYVTQALAEPAAQPPADSNEPAPVKPHLATTNNVLDAVKKACDHKIKCRVSTNSKTLGDDPLPSCFKTLQVSYRCFSYDRVQNIEAGQNEPLIIDCHEAAAASKK